MTILSSAVAIANKVTKALKFQAQVTHKSFVSDAGVGDVTPTTKKRDAVVDKKQRLIRTFSGQMATSNATVMFLDPAVTVTEHDSIILPDGTGGPVIGTAGFVDKGGQLYTEAYLG